MAVVKVEEKSDTWPLFTRQTDILPQDLVKSRRCKIWVYTFPIALKFNRHLSSNAAEMPVNYQSDTIIIRPNLVALRLHEILRYDVLPLTRHLVNRSPLDSQKTLSVLPSQASYGMSYMMNIMLCYIMHYVLTCYVISYCSVMFYHVLSYEYSWTNCLCYDKTQLYFVSVPCVWQPCCGGTAITHPTELSIWAASCGSNYPWEIPSNL